MRSDGETTLVWIQTFSHIHKLLSSSASVDYFLSAVFAVLIVHYDLWATVPGEEFQREE